MTQRPRPFTAEEIARIIHLRDAKGFSFLTIGRLLGRPGPDGCRDRYIRAKREAAGLHGIPARVALNCLRCRGPFMSEDRRRHRLCSGCSAGAADASPFEPDYDAPAPVATR